jgi:hypothetical protein
MISDDERAIPLSLFHYARSFWQSAVLLECSDLNGIMHPRAPITLLLCQAIELYLKAFLRLREGRIEGLRHLRRRYKAIARDARKKGLPLSDHDLMVVKFLAATNAFLASRHSTTGEVKALPAEKISETCASLDSLVSKALVEEGNTVMGPWDASIGRHMGEDCREREATN